MPLDTPPPIAGLTQDDILAFASAELSPLYARLLTAFADRSKVKAADVDEILAAIQDVYARVNLLGLISGYLSPWVPRVQETPGRTIPAIAPAPVRQLSQVHYLASWEQLQSAMNWLSGKIRQFPARIVGLVTRSQLSAAAFGVDVDRAMIETLNSELQESIELGEGRDKWRERMKGIVETRRGFDETIARTAMHRAFHEGKNEILEEPVMQDVFPYRKYYATMDNRVRETHAALNEKIYHKDSRLFEEAQKRLSEYNCRCSEVPMTEEDALAEGVSMGGQPPSSIRPRRPRSAPLPDSYQVSAA